MPRACSRALIAIVVAGIALTSFADGDVPPSQPLQNPLTLAEAAADGVKFANLATARPRLVVTLVNTSNLSATNARVWGTGFTAVDEKGQTLPGNALSFSLDKFERKVVHLRPYLPSIGKQTAMFWLSSDGSTAKAIAVEFNRIETPKTPLTAGDVPGQRVPIPFGSWTAGTSFVLPLHETAGTPARDIRASVRLAMKVDDKVSFAAPAPRLRLNDCERLDLGPGEWLDVPVSIDGIDRPGQYEATILLRTGHDAPIETKPITLFVRQSWGLAAALILLGVVTSLFLRLLTKVIRPRLAVQQRLAGLVDSLRDIRRQTNDSQAKGLIDRLEHSLERRYGTLSLGGRVLGAADFDIYDAKLPLLQAWIDNHARLAGASLPGNAANVAQKGLGDAANVLDDENATADAVRAQLSALAALRNSVDDALAIEIHTQVSTLQAAILESGEAELQPLLERIAAVEALLIAREMQEALAEARALQFEYVKAFAALFRRQLRTRPVSFPQPQWPALVQDVQVPLDAAIDAGDAAMALTQLRLAITKFIPPTAEALAAAIDEELNTTPDYAPLLVLKDDVEKLQKAVAAKELDGAPRRIDALQTRYEQIKGGGALSTTAAAADVVSWAGDMLGGLLGPKPWKKLTASGASAGLIWRQRLVGLLATILIAALAVLLGLKVLWSNAWTWGSAQDYLIAFLWGAGLHQFSFEGLSGLLDREKW